jgi:glycosyltransferase involved in cell wall biosynthesis
VEWGIPRERILLEEYGRRLVARPEAGSRSQDPAGARLGFFGQMNPYKGVDVLLAAMVKHAAGPGPHARAWLHGANLDLQEHGFRDAIAELLAEAGEHVTYAGPYEPERVGELMAAVDWVVVPSVWWENSPLVIQEAFAHGRPVICSDIGGMAEKVADGVNGLHFRVGDPDSLAAVIGRVARSPELWERLRAGIPPVHAMADHVAVLSEAYDRLLGETGEARESRWPAAIST